MTRTSTAIAACAWLLTVAASTVNAEPSHAICPLTLEEERTEREEVELALDVAVSRLVAEEAIFSLVDQLWQKEAIQRITHVTAKHDRDVAALDVQRLQALLERQAAVIEQYTIVCSSARPETIEAARRRYAEADCRRIAKDLAIAEVDLAYFGELLASVRDLRKGDVATQQDVIRAELDLESARKRLVHYTAKVRQCPTTGEQEKASPSAPDSGE